MTYDLTFIPRSESSEPIFICWETRAWLGHGWIGITVETQGKSKNIWVG